MSLFRFLTGFLVVLLIVTASVQIVVTSTPAAVTVQIHSQNYDSHRRHRPDPSPAPLTAVAPPPRVYISPHLGRFFISRVLAPPLFCITALPNRKEAPRILLVWRHDCSNGVKPPPTEALRPSPNDGSRPLNLIVVVDWLLRCRSVTSCWSRYVNAEVRSVELISTSAPSRSSWWYPSPDYFKAPYLLSDAYSHTLNRNEYVDNLLKFLPVTSWPRHGNVKVRTSDPIKPYASSPNSIILSASKVKLELEIHLVSLVSIVDFRAVHLHFNDKPRLSRPFDTIAVEKDSPVPPSQTLMFGFINVDSDNLKLVNSSVLGKQVKNHLYGFLLFEQVSSFNMSILCLLYCILFILPSRLAAPVVIILSVLFVLV